VSDLKQVSVPDIGDFSDVAVVEVHVTQGDEVAENDPLVTLETDKATMDVPAPFGGVVAEVLLKVGDVASEGTAVVSLSPSAEAAASAEAGAPSAVRTAVAADHGQVHEAGIGGEDPARVPVDLLAADRDLGKQALPVAQALGEVTGRRIVLVAGVYHRKMGLAQGGFLERKLERRLGVVDVPDADRDLSVLDAIGNTDHRDRTAGVHHHVSGLRARAGLGVAADAVGPDDEQRRGFRRLGQ